MSTFARLISIAVAAVVAFSAVPAAAPDIDIPYARFVLDNGLTLIVHEDHKAPIVAVNVWYHVGSKNEKPGRTGFAHLFEHLMFNGSEHFDDDYFKPFDRVGATGMNGTTNHDRTNYFQNVPSSELDLALWMESDRMGHLLGAVDQAKLDEQRGVVQNEKRQGENQPYGTARRLIVENTYPAGHPYSWSVIGSMEDLDAATLEDVHEWFRAYYGAANAVVVVAGDVDTAEVRRKVETYFGDIPPGPPLTRPQVWIAKREETTRMVVQDRVPQGRVYKAWNIPQLGSDDALLLSLVNDLLTRGKNSRLYQRLVYENRLATAVSGRIVERELGSTFLIDATAAPNANLRAINRQIDLEIAALIDAELELPMRELNRVKNQHFADFVRGAERVGGFGGKSDILARYEIYAGDPGQYQRDLQRIAAAKPQFVVDVARRWLSSGDFVLEVHPFPEMAAADTGVDRSSLPQPGPAPEVRFPEIERAELSNGLQVLLVERHAVPTVDLQLVIDAGFASDESGRGGTAALAMDMLDEGTETQPALRISELLALNGATLRTDSDLDTSSVSLTALKSGLDAALDLFADVIQNPAFPEEELERLRAEQLARVRREMASPRQAGLRVMPKLLYGSRHAYSIPWTGSGTEASVAAIDVDDLRKFHDKWFDPAAATLIVVGDTTLEEMRPKLEHRFQDWSGGKRPKRSNAAEGRTGSGVYLVDRPGSTQSTVIAARLAPPRAADGEVALEALNQVFGGSFTARINMNLREDKGIGPMAREA